MWMWQLRLVDDSARLRQVGWVLVDSKMPDFASNGWKRLACCAARRFLTSAHLQRKHQDRSFVFAKALQVCDATRRYRRCYESISVTVCREKDVMMPLTTFPSCWLELPVTQLASNPSRFVPQRLDSGWPEAFQHTCNMRFLAEHCASGLELFCWNCPIGNGTFPLQWHLPMLRVSAKTPRKTCITASKGHPVGIEKTQDVQKAAYIPHSSVDAGSRSTFPKVCNHIRKGDGVLPDLAYAPRIPEQHTCAGSEQTCFGRSVKVGS